MQEEMARMPKGTYIKLMFQFVKDGILITTTDTKYYQMENLKKQQQSISKEVYKC